jgi:hypothetical protein
MYKVIRMVKRGEKSLPEFKQEWLERNRELKRAANRVVASVAAEGKVLGDEAPPYDGIAAIYFSTAQTARAAADKGLGAEAISVVAEEKVLFARPDADKILKAQGQLKVVLTVQRKKDLTSARFKDAWVKSHAKIEHKVLLESPLQKMVASFAVPEEGKTPDFDGMVELYFASTDDIKATFGGPIPGMLRKDEETYVQMDAPEIRIIAEEYVL